MRALPGYEEPSDFWGEYRFNPYVGPVVLTDLTCDWEAKAPYIASFDYNDYAYATDNGFKYNITLTSGNPYALKKILDLIKETDFSDCVNGYKRILNTQLSYIGSFSDEGDLPKNPQIGQMCVLNDKMYVYDGNDWAAIMAEKNNLKKDIDKMKECFDEDYEIEMDDYEPEDDVKMFESKYKLKHRRLYNS